MRPTPEPHLDGGDAAARPAPPERAAKGPLDHEEVARRARTLRRALAALDVAIAGASCEPRAVAVPSYPDGPRPSSIVTLAGHGSSGRGEHVGWSADAHRAFAERCARLPLASCDTVGDVAALLARALDDPYDRAALEAAAIDLALRQAGSNLCALSGIRLEPVRYVVSFERVADPVGRAAAELRARPALELKIDADPLWSESTLAALAELGRVRVLDFKLAGSVAAHERAHRQLPSALLEDPLPGPEPWSASLRARLSLDAPIRSALALAEQPVQPAAVNVKPARIGGVLAALDVIAACATRGIDVYFGGMFEVDVGRAHVQTLAALLCPDAPNDVAPIASAGRAAERPPRLEIAPPDAGLAAW